MGYGSCRGWFGIAAGEREEDLFQTQGHRTEFIEIPSALHYAASQIAANGFAYPASQTPWQEIHRSLTGQFAGGAVLESAVKYQRIVQTAGKPRDSH